MYSFFLNSVMGALVLSKKNLWSGSLNFRNLTSARYIGIYI